MIPSGEFWAQSANWVQAIGTIVALVGAIWVAAGDSRNARRREEQGRKDALEKEARDVTAVRTAALNLAVLALTQIHDLHLLLRDETRRSRITRVSPSRTLLTTERQLTAFPIQSLCDAPAMVAFSYFPGALATAAEVYANLEAEVRAVEDPARGAVFAEYAQQMGRLNTMAQDRLTELGRALGIAPTVISGFGSVFGHDLALEAPSKKPAPDHAP